MVHAGFLISVLALAADAKQCPSGWHCVRPSQLASNFTKVPGCPRSVSSRGCTVQGHCPSSGYTSDLPHIAAAPSKSVSRLVLHIFLHGTNTSALDYLGWLQASRDAGFFTIGLSYASSPFVDADVSRFCSCSSDLFNSSVECLTKYHDSALFGGHATPWNPGTKNSIVARLHLLLDYLQYHYPSEDWIAFRWNGDIAWWASMWSGHSQGGGHVAYLLKMEKLYRAVLLSAPQDIVFQAEPEENVSMATPFANVYGLAHLAEDNVDIIMRNWRAMALLAARDNLALIDKAVARTTAVGTLHVARDAANAPPGSRLFALHGEPSGSCNCKTRAYHCSTAKDSCELTTSVRNDFWHRLLDAGLTHAPKIGPASFSVNEGGEIMMFILAIIVVLLLSVIGFGLLWRRRRESLGTNFSQFDDVQDDSRLRELGHAAHAEGSREADVLGNAAL